MIVFFLCLFVSSFVCMFRLFVFSRALFDYILVLVFFGLLGFAPTQQNISIAVPHRTGNAKQARGETIFNLLGCLGRSDLCHGSVFLKGALLSTGKRAAQTSQRLGQMSAQMRQGLWIL